MHVLNPQRVEESASTTGTHFDAEQFDEQCVRRKRGLITLIDIEPILPVLHGNRRTLRTFFACVNRE